MFNPLPHIKESIRAKRVQRMIRKDGKMYKKMVAAYSQYDSKHLR